MTTTHDFHYIASATSDAKSELSLWRKHVSASNFVNYESPKRELFFYPTFQHYTLVTSKVWDDDQKCGKWLCSCYFSYISVSPLLVATFQLHSLHLNLQNFIIRLLCVILNTMRTRMGNGHWAHY